MRTKIKISWAHRKATEAAVGDDWLSVAREAGFAIPTGCLGGSCGACEIEVNGQIKRACIDTVPECNEGILVVELPTDPYW